MHLLQSIWYILSQWLKSLVFALIRGSLGVGQSIWWRINGTHQQIQYHKNPKNPNRCAQVMKVITSNKFCILEHTTLKDYLCFHDGFVRPEYVVENDEVVLSFLDHETNEMIFCEGARGEPLLWRTELSPGMYLTTLVHTKRLIKMPLDMYNDLAETLPDPKQNLIMITNVARCGSSLLSSVFDRTGKIITYSEHHIFSEAAIMYREQGMTEEVKTFTRHALRMMCKPLKCLPDPVAYAFKPSGPALEVVLVMKEIFPKVTTLFMYRDLTATSASLYRLSWALTSLRVAYLLCRMSQSMIKDAYKGMGLPPPEIKGVFKDDFTLGIFIVLGSIQHYNERIRGLPEVYAITYEDLVKDRVASTRAIFKLCGVPLDLVKSGVEAFKIDAHKNSPTNGELLKKVPQLTITEEDRVRASAFLVQNGFPPLDQELRLEGTADLHQE